MEVRYPITLSVSEPNNNVGLLKIRQTDQGTQTLVVEITENGIPKGFTGLKPFFCAKISGGLGLGLIEQEVDGSINSANGKLEYTLKPTDWQSLGRHTAYFSFRRMNANGSFSEQFTTKDFYYNVIKSVYSDGVTEAKTDGSTYLWTFEDLKRQLDEYLAAGKSDWNDFLDENKEILSSLDPNGELLNQLNDLKKQLDEATSGNSMDIADEVMGGIRDIFEAPLFDIKNQLESRKNNVNIGHITDVHYVVRSNYWGTYPAASYGLTHLLNIGAVSDSLDLIVAGGDNADENNKSKTNILKHQRDFATTLDTVSNCPIVIGIGNHDDQSVRAAEAKQTGNDFLITDDEFAEIYFQKSSRFGEVRDGKSNYCYYDLPNSNIRVVWLDLYQNPTTLGVGNVMKYPRSNTSVIQESQLKWLANTAFKTNKDVLVFCHCPINGTFSGQPTTYWHNHDVILQLLNGFEGKTSGTLLGSSADFPVNMPFDFSGQTGNLIAVVCGHKHKDDFMIQNNINYVITAQSVAKDFDGTEYWYTSEEDSWSVFSIDESSKSVEILKFGRGTGRSFGYGGTN
ncbi:BppU family phage baseplate upper protein [Enterococcus faecium]|nr:BppU family phage baseplate upper protein [Enterococcus faecium]